MTPYMSSLKRQNYNSFPFAAIVGQERLKRALILNLVNPKIGGVLISGEKGTAKSTLVRSLAGIMGNMAVVNIPLNITEDRLVGGIDLQTAIKTGSRRLEEGLLQKAHNQLLYIDEVNLLREHIVNIITEVSSGGINIVERDGISCSHPVSFVLVGSMNPEEGPLKPQFVDRFGLYVEAKGEADAAARAEIIERRLAFEKNPRDFWEEWQEENDVQRQRILKAKALLPEVKAPRAMCRLAVALAAEGGCSGHRAEIIMIETARGVAAYEGRGLVTPEDVREAAHYVLPHRIKETISLETIEASRSQEVAEEPPPKESEEEPLLQDGNTISKESEEIPQGSREEEAILQQPEAIASRLDSISLTGEDNGRKKTKGFGKRSKVKNQLYKGRYAGYRLPRGNIKDIALSATLRTAALRGRAHRDKGLALSISTEDIRVKLREARTGATIMFAVDASASMGAAKRMSAVKGAILALLRDAYQKRDRVGLVAFRGSKAEVLLNITRSVDLAEACLREIPTGGRTPLALGLLKAYQLLKAERVKNPEALQYLVVVSDGKGNMSIKGGNPREDALEIAKKLAYEGIKSLVLDTEAGFIEYHFSKELAEALGGRHLKLREVTGGAIRDNVKRLIRL